MPRVIVVFMIIIVVGAIVSVMTAKREHHHNRASCQRTVGNSYVIDINNVGHCVRTSS
jgi:hypothetical protein